MRETGMLRITKLQNGLLPMCDDNNGKCNVDTRADCNEYVTTWRPTAKTMTRW